MSDNVDIIGDVHGHSDRLEALLRALGYRERGGAWRHPSRTAVFVGDLIDRGPGQLRTLQIVRNMVEAGAAEAAMGNHELNAIGWATPAEDGDDHLRPRKGRKGEKNRRQHAAFLAEVGEDSEEHRAWVDWFGTLPVYIERPGYRVVHAAWCPSQGAVAGPHLDEGGRLKPDRMQEAFRKGGELNRALDVLLKGPEVALPEGVTFTDKDGHVRGEIRTRWWDRGARTYAEAYIGPDGVEIPDVPVGEPLHLPEPDRPTFVGHYWLDHARGVAPLSARVACVDYSVAKGGPMTAYRFDGEPVLTADKFVVV